MEGYITGLFFFNMSFPFRPFFMNKSETRRIDFVVAKYAQMDRMNEAMSDLRVVY